MKLPTRCIQQLGSPYHPRRRRHWGSWATWATSPSAPTRWWFWVQLVSWMISGALKLFHLISDDVWSFLMVYFEVSFELRAWQLQGFSVATWELLGVVVLLVDFIHISLDMHEPIVQVPVCFCLIKSGAMERATLFSWFCDAQFLHIFVANWTGQLLHAQRRCFMYVCPQFFSGASCVSAPGPLGYDDHSCQDLVYTHRYIYIYIHTRTYSYINIYIYTDVH